MHGLSGANGLQSSRSTRHLGPELRGSWRSSTAACFSCLANCITTGGAGGGEERGVRSPAEPLLLGSRERPPFRRATPWMALAPFVAGREKRWNKHYPGKHHGARKAHRAMVLRREFFYPPSGGGGRHRRPAQEEN